jgi:hypothetical protein
MKRTVAIALTLLVIVALMVLWGAEPIQRSTVADEKILLLLTNDDTGWFFLQLREGAQAACQNQGALLRTLVISSDSLPAQLGSISADAALVFVSQEEDRAMVQHFLQENAIPYRMILDGDEGTIHMDERGGAMQLARIIPSNHTLVSVYTDEDAAVSERMLGALDYMGDRAPVKVTPGEALPASLHFARACLALDAEATRYIVDAKERGLLPASLLLFGYDTVETRVKDLESGTVYAMLMPEPYTLGYNGALASMTGQMRPSPLGRVITKRTMFLSRNVRLVFPLIQTD